MSRLYASPLRVYLCLGVLALAGVVSGLSLPVSLFPNSTKPRVNVGFGYGSGTSDDFINTYGRTIEEQLRAVSGEGLEVERVLAEYHSGGASYDVHFRWGVSGQAALREIQARMTAFAARMPQEMRDGMSVWTRGDNSGFLAVSFYSPKRGIDELYKVLDPVLGPRLARVSDAQEAVLWNPTGKEVQVEIKPEAAALLHLFPRDLERAVTAALGSHGGGTVPLGTQSLKVQVPREVTTVEDLGRVLVPTPGGRNVHLSDVARIDFAPRTSSRQSFKTSGAPSLILFATPRAGGNVKRMAEEILAAVREVEPSLPQDIRYKVLVDPSEFIRSSVRNVFHEVAIGALLAVTILFLFIGSFRNVVTAAIEIPLSMILAFILMKLGGMNLNLISLGGLALSAGMNVDASVVVMENIFRHLEGKGRLTFAERLAVVTRAVGEVRFAVIASTIASLVVFLPLAFTSDLSYAILGDLAKTVVFSHGLSAFVALLLVPTVRLHLMSREGERPREIHSPIEGRIRWLEAAYGRLLDAFLRARRVRLAAYAGIGLVLVALAAFVGPRLPREIIGEPDTDWLVLGMDMKGANTKLSQMETQAEEIEARLLGKFGAEIQYTFTHVWGVNGGRIMSRLKNRRHVRGLIKKFEEEFTNTPFVQFWVSPWNPSELPIPNPPQLQLVVTGPDRAAVAEATRQIDELLSEKKAFPRVWTQPGTGREQQVVLRGDPAQWEALRERGHGVGPGDLADLVRVATDGRRIGQLSVDGLLTDVNLRYPENSVGGIEDLAALPVGLGTKLVPLQALARVSLELVPPRVFREDQRELFTILGRTDRGKESAAGEGIEKARALVGEWKKTDAARGITVQFEDAQKDLHEALRQLGIAVALSIVLIFLTLVLQFGDVIHSLLVLVAVPLGFIGVLISLFAFGSTLSLNSALGVILLNGISVANSIILVDFMKRLVDGGMAPREAAVEAARKRLRPILITSLTTVLGMLPIALGFGEGGRILQPLGIAVSGGLWVSMGLTLFVVPALQVGYLEWKARRRRLVARGEVLRAGEREARAPALPASATVARAEPPELRP